MLDFFASNVLNNALQDHVAEDGMVWAVDRVGDDWSVSDGEEETRDAVDELEGMIPWEAVLGRDMSVHLGKDKAKVPKFDRFVTHYADIVDVVRATWQHSPRTTPGDFQLSSLEECSPGVDDEVALAEATISEELQLYAAEEEMQHAEVDRFIQEETEVTSDGGAKALLVDACSSNVDCEVDQLIQEELVHSAGSCVMSNRSSPSCGSMPPAASETACSLKEVIPAGSPAVAVRQLRLRQKSAPTLLLQEGSGVEAYKLSGQRGPFLGSPSAARHGGESFDTNFSAMAMDLRSMHGMEASRLSSITKTVSSSYMLKPTGMFRTKSQPAGVQALTKSKGVLGSLGDNRNRPVWTVVQPGF